MTSDSPEQHVSRTHRSARNAAAGIFAQGVIVLLGFATRTVFIDQLGVELLGVQTLLLSLLALATVADLGMGSALMFALYQPLRDGDHEQSAAIVRYAGRLYRWVALATVGVGLAALPFLDSLVTLEEPVPNLGLYYLVMLANSALYFPLYSRTLLLEADQRSYWIKLVSVGFNVGRSVAQIAVLLVWGSFLLFLVVQVVSTVLNNVFVYRYVGRQYPYLSEPADLGPEPRKEVARSVRAMLVYRVSGLALNNTDPILISILVGTLALGYYSNYLLIVGSLVMVLEVAFSALTPSVGNLVASHDQAAMRRVLSEIQLLAVGVYGVSSVLLLVVMQDVIRLWLGASFVLSTATLYALVANFYVVGAMSPVATFRGATGLFRETRYVLLVTATLNLLFSVPLGLIFGLPGVLFATLAARLLTNVWFEPWVLFRRHLGGGAGQFIVTHVLALVIFGGCYAACIVLLDAIPGEAWGAVLAGAALASLLVCAALASVFGRTAAARSLSKRAVQMLRRPVS